MLMGFESGSSLCPGPAGRGRLDALREGRGFTLVEAVVGIGLFSLILLAILLVTGTSWKTEVKARTDHKAQWVARGILQVITNGDPHPAVPVKGLLQASEVATDPANSALAYRVTWIDSSEVVHDDAVHYYLLGEKVYRRVEAYTSPLTPLTTGGAEIADGVTSFVLSADGAIPVEITVTVSYLEGNSVTLQTKVTPRNLPSEGES